MSEFFLYKIGESVLAELLPTDIVIEDTQAFLDLMILCGMHKAHTLIVHKDSLHPDFFDLSTKFAGELIQKAVNYQFRLLIIGEYENHSSKSLRDFMREANQGTTVNFFGSVEEALTKISV
jgi:hypothetical protein